MTLRFRPKVADDLRDARTWYEGRREGLGDEFMEAVERMLERVDRTPEQFPIIHRNVHRALIRRFPYAIFFIQEDGERVVLAVLHQAVNPARWPK